MIYEFIDPEGHGVKASATITQQSYGIIKITMHSVCLINFAGITSQATRQPGRHTKRPRVLGSQCRLLS